MRLRLATVTLALVAGCRGSYEPPAPVLTLVPAAMRSGGPAVRADDDTLCLAAGASVEATVYAYQSTVTIMVTASAATPEMTDLTVRLGSRLVATDAIRATRAEASVYRSQASRGEQVLRLSVPENSPGRLCLRQVVVTQP